MLALFSRRAAPLSDLVSGSIVNRLSRVKVVVLIVVRKGLHMCAIGFAPHGSDFHA